MSQNELMATITDLQELRRMQEELDAEVTALQDRIKAHMGETEQMTVGAFKVLWKPVTTARIDTAMLKKELPDVAARYCKTVEARRFQVS